VLPEQDTTVGGVPSLREREIVSEKSCRAPVL